MIWKCFWQSYRRRITTWFEASPEVLVVTILIIFWATSNCVNIILQWQTTAGFLYRGSGTKCSCYMLQSTESLQPHLLPHACSKRLQFNNPLVYWSCRFEKCRLGLQQSSSDLCWAVVPPHLRHSVQLSVGSFSEGGGREGSCYQDHFLDWVFTNNCISPPKKATEYRLGT